MPFNKAIFNFSFHNHICFNQTQSKQKCTGRSLILFSYSNRFVKHEFSLVLLMFRDAKDLLAAIDSSLNLVFSNQFCQLVFQIFDISAKGFGHNIQINCRKRRKVLDKRFSPNHVKQAFHVGAQIQVQEKVVLQVNWDEYVCYNQARKLFHLSINNYLPYILLKSGDMCCIWNCRTT